MTVKEETVPTRTDLSGTQRALLEERLKRAKQAASRPGEPRPSIPRRTTDDELPLSFAQQRLWFLDQLEPGSAVYNVCQAVRFTGVLDVRALERTLNEIVRRHEVLRTNFVAVEGRPVQQIAKERAVALTLVDVSARPDDARTAECQRVLYEESRRPFDLASDVLLRALLVRTSPTEHTLLLTVHHIISDGWSIGILFREIAALYEGYSQGQTPTLPELPVQYADYVLWERDSQQGPATDRLLAYWRKQLQAPLPVLDLPVDHPRTAEPTSRGATYSVQFPPALTQELKALSQSEGSTLFMTLLAAFQVLLHRWTGQEDITVGSVVAGRRKVELENLIGFFVNTLVFRGDLSGTPTFRELLTRTREAALGAMAHQDLPFERLVNELRPDRTGSRNPLFQVMFVLQNAPMSPTSLPQLEAHPVEIDNGTAKFDLTLQMLEGADGLRASLEYNADHFEAETIARFMRGFETLLQGIAARPEQRIGELPLLTPGERAQVLELWNQTSTPYPRAATITQLFEQQVDRTPLAPAVSCGKTRLTYAQLDARANQLARWLRRSGVGPETLVGVSMERSAELIVALVAILKAGGTYVSLDPSYPPERLAFMLRDTAAPVLLTQRALRDRVEAFVHAPVSGEDGGAPGSRDPALQVPTLLTPTMLCLDSEWARVANESEARLPGTVTADHLAYVSYTSGSTGRPKGVCVPHRGVARLVRNPNYATFGPDDIFLQFAPIAFDASTLEIWGPLLNGGQLAVYPPGATSLADLGEFIDQAGITTLWLTAGLFHQMIEEQVHRLRKVRQLLSGGDVLSPAHVTRALENLPTTRLINGYGPTENTTFTCCHPVTRAPAPGHTVPIGQPIANTEVYILDANQQPTPIGVPGELYTGGDGLARGYLNHPELTAEKFVLVDLKRDPAAQPSAAGIRRLYRTGDRARWLADGTIEFLGRIDRQVKIRGFRVEPAEVEAVLAAHPDVKECAVVVRDDPAGGKRLVAFVVASRQPAPGVETWRSYLLSRVPEHLVPAAFHALASLPLTPNGKLDTRALPADDVRPDLQGQYVAPRDEIERQLVGIWEAVLNVHPIGVHDQFFVLGGHSLMAVRMVAQLEKLFGKKLPVAAIFHHRTVEQLARLLRDPEPTYTSTTSIVEIRGEGTQPRLYLVHGVGGGMFWGYSNLARHLGPDQPLYAFKSRGLDGQPELPTVEEMAASYVADLRAQQPTGPYLLGGYCFGGIVAYEIARQLHAVGQEVALLALINGSPPNTSYQHASNRYSPLWIARFLGNLAYWLGCFAFRWTWQERREFVRWKLRVLWRRRTEAAAAKHAQVALGDIDQLVDLAAYSEERRALWRSHVAALMKYQPQPYDGHVTLIRTRGHPLFSSFDYQYGWADLARGGVDVNIVAGGHGNVLAEPYVGAVARALRPTLAAIKRARKPEGAS